ncbi:MAG: GNAT family N-acetyltransferase [Ilumatobacter sp.]|nr:GNAT family N-acetyltransferase [Ilumatobacter sp.]
MASGWSTDSDTAPDTRFTRVTVEIRRARPGDLDTVLALVEEYCEADGHEFEPVRARAGIEPLLADDVHGVIWLAELDGTADGYAAVTWGWSIEIGGPDVVLDELYVRTQRQGTGAALIERLEADCRARAVRRIFLETEAGNDGARRLYARHGYVADDSIWMAKTL